MRNSILFRSISVAIMAMFIGFIIIVVLPAAIFDSTLFVLLGYPYVFILGPIIGFTFGRIKYKELKGESANPIKPIQNKSTFKPKVKLVDISEDSTITINGETWIGNSVTIKNGKVSINGNDVTPDSKSISITINGNINDLSVDRCESIMVDGDVGGLRTTSGNINVTGNVTDSIKLTSGNIKCNDVGGSIKTTSGEIECHTVNGNATSVHGKVIIKNKLFT